MALTAIVLLRPAGCRGLGADEVKSHPFFSGLDWQLVYLQKYPPPLIPPRGEVNAADAFDIGSFDEEDTKGMYYHSVIPQNRIQPMYNVS